jgi:hypothetical protein
MRPAGVVVVVVVVLLLGPSPSLTWQHTKVAREKPMHMRQAMKPPELLTVAMPKVAMDVRSWMKPWP